MLGEYKIEPSGYLKFLDFKLPVYGNDILEEPQFLITDLIEMLDGPLESVGELVDTINEDNIRHDVSEGKDVIFDNENGLYDILLRSDYPLAKEFTDEVKKILKAFRKKGYFETRVTFKDKMHEFEERIAAEEYGVENEYYKV